MVLEKRLIGNIHIHSCTRHGMSWPWRGITMFLGKLGKDVSSILFVGEEQKNYFPRTNNITTYTTTTLTSFEEALLFSLKKLTLSLLK